MLAVGVVDAGAHDELVGFESAVHRDRSPAEAVGIGWNDTIAVLVGEGQREIGYIATAADGCGIGCENTDVVKVADVVFQCDIRFDLLAVVVNGSPRTDFPIESRSP